MKCVAKYLMNLGFSKTLLLRCGFHGYEILHAMRNSTRECRISKEELERITEGSYCKLGKGYFALKLRQKGYTRGKIAVMLGISSDMVWSYLKNEKRKEKYRQEKNMKILLSQKYRQYRRKKISIEMLVEVIRYIGYHRGLKVLKTYVGYTAIKNTMKRYCITKEMLKYMSFDEIQKHVVNTFCVQKTGISLDDLCKKLKEGPVTSIGTKEWDRLRNTGMKKRLIVEHLDNLEQFIINHIWRYLSLRQTEMSISRFAKVDNLSTLL